MATWHRYRRTHLERFAELLRAWLTGLPADGWTGSVGELQAALGAHPCGRLAGVPAGPGLTKALMGFGGLIREAGWVAAWRRNKKGRWIEFRRRPAVTEGEGKPRRRDGRERSGGAT